MKFYRCLWVTITVVIVSAVAVFDVIAYGWLRLTVWGLTVGVFGGVVGHALAVRRADRWLWARRGLGWAGFGAVAADALVTTLGTAGALIASAVLVTSPAVVGTLHRRALRRSAQQTSGPPEALVMRDLLRRWEWTSEQVVRADTPLARRLGLAEERSNLLDEIERRDPPHFATWMASAALDRPADHQ